MRLPRLLPPSPFVALPTPTGHAYCVNCRDWRRFDVIEAITDKDVEVVPAFVICAYCGVWVDYELEETA